MAAETQYTANTGMVKMSTGNSNLDGVLASGTYYDVITGASNGTLIKTVSIKATGATAQGMVRLFVYSGSGNARLIKEIDVPTITPTANNPAFETTIHLDFKLASGYILKATTQNSNNFNVIAEGLNISYYTTLVRPESTQYVANTGLALASTANTNLDGSGTVVTPLTAGSSATYKGCAINSITIKAIGATETRGMVRIYIQNSAGTAASNTFLLTEIVIPNGENPSGTFKSFEHKITFPHTLQIAADYKIVASTEVGESYSIIVEGMDWKYPSDTYSANFTPASTTGDTSEHIIHALQVPAGIFTTGNLMEVHASLNVTNSANNKTWKIRINSANSLTSAVTIGTYVITNPITDTITRYFPVISDTVVECYAGAANSQESQYGSNTNASANSATLTSLSAGFWVLITCTLANGTETGTCRWSMVSKKF